ncbi:Tropinesterase [Nonomuraea coxensis DSM 45129]|uniref:Tropinesterase n=1 Tax=Nonomuraea coxensis DSM 45129 TaxID=1122611 RepID=A0ABX8U8V4_9ACTN|nr:alpha/beta fold hydrolase [Nonomuraea coxensis]QYC43284.1 Tropinesterase [Nonomuraea coxensis DSM 45129]
MTIIDGELLPLKDGALHVREDGPRDAPALLLIHGTAATARTWDALTPLLTGSHRVIRVDLLGHGRSAKPAGGGYAVPDHARRAAEALDLLGVGRAAVAGHSSGGTVATALAERRPDLVSALALVGTGPCMDAFIGPETGRPPAGGAPAAWPPGDEQIRAMATSGFSRPGFRVPAELLDDLRDSLRDTPPAVFAAVMRAPRDYLEERTLPERLAPLGIPLLVIFGEDDRRWRPSSAADYRAVPGARIELIPGVGHTPVLEDAPRTAELLLSFL